MCEDVLVAGLEATSDDACYRAMDWLLEIRGALEKEVFGRLAALPGTETDLLFFDTTSTYFVTEEADAPVARDQRGNPAPGGADGEVKTASPWGTGSCWKWSAAGET